MQERQGWRFDNTYARLPERFYARLSPTPVSQPGVVVKNRQLAAELGLPLADLPDEELAQLFAGNRLPDGAEPIAQAYSGHQFGYFTQLGDGRAHLIGEHLTPGGERVDIQFKGSGRTPFGRGGDGRAALGPMLREYLISEAMHALGIATTRSLAVVTTGEEVYRDSVLPGAILTRTAASHLRVGTFEHLAARRDTSGLKQLADYAIARHYPQLQHSDQPYLELIKAVMEKQIALVVDWLRVGFIHGVMNTDNMTISGETIDYGPCAFMDEYDPATVFSSIDHAGRYAYGNQPYIVKWNLTRFAEALLPLLHDDVEEAATRAGEMIDSFDALFHQARLAMLRRKLGLSGEQKEDESLADELLDIMQRQQADYTNTFRGLIARTLPGNEFFQTEEMQNWWGRWQQRLELNDQPRESAFSLMRASNPAVIPRNHRVEAALSTAEAQSDFSRFLRLLDVLAEPYADEPARPLQTATEDYKDFRQPPEPGERVRQTFCGT